MKDKLNIQLIAGAIALACLLSYTLVHTGGLLAHYIKPAFVGYVAAFGIEASIVGLSLRIGDLKRSKQSTTFFIFVLVAVVIVSAIANIAEGFYTQQEQFLTLATIRQLDPIQAVIGLTATGLISLIVLAMSEIIGTDLTAVAKQAAKDDVVLVRAKDELADVRKQLAGITKERDRLQQQLDNGVVVVDQLPPKFAAVVTAVANGEKLNGPLVTKHGIAQSTLDRVATLTRE
mgnify:CR=1 FL=1|jgi:hypothetical protein